MISFIILHYKNMEDTIECLESLKKFNKQDISIIVVDNNTLSNDEIFEIKKYTEDIVLNNENLGFAKGNNIGADYAIKKYHPDFLCIINSDTIINQTNFIEIIYDLYDQYNFDMLGPKILPEETESCNPFRVYKTIEEVQERINYTEKLIKIYQNKILRFLLKIYLNVKSIFRKKKNLKNGTSEETNVALHGCAIIFSKKYYEKFNHIFYPGTFLFHEEEFLYQRCIQYNLISLYSPRLEIIHKEGQSVIKEFNHQKYESLIFRNKEILKSLNLLKQQMQKKKRM